MAKPINHFLRKLLERQLLNAVVPLLSFYVNLFIYFIIYSQFISSVITTNLFRLTENILNKRKGKTTRNQMIIQNLKVVILNYCFIATLYADQIDN